MGEKENYGQSNNVDNAARKTIDLATGRGDWTILKKEAPKAIQEEAPLFNFIELAIKKPEIISLLGLNSNK